ncbi:hypothetical protein HYU06_00970 [Candidatus Woesearchaeota archaeon]|nr:hypothetical protein [Candidatus Woesearchaeota archaeon]
MALKKINKSRNFCNNKSAQIFSLDMIFAAAVFIIILLGIGFAWDHNREKLALTEQRNDAAIAARNMMNSLMETEGNPSNWTKFSAAAFNKTNIKSLGLVKTLSINKYDSYKKTGALALAKNGPGFLSADKILTLYTDYESYYNGSKGILGLDRRYDYEIAFQLGENFTSYGFLGTSSIAYTYANGNANDGDAANFGIRAYLEENNVLFTNYGSDWQSLISNIDDYEAVIFEDPHLDDNDLTSQQQDALRSWVNSGGIYFQKEHGRMIEIFNISTNDAGTSTGTVVKIDPYLTNLQINETMRFSKGYRISKQDGGLVTLVQHASGNTEIGYFDYGSGRVYYIPDTEGNIEFANGTQKYDNTRIALTLPKPISNATFGYAPQNASNVVVIQRRAYLDDNRKINVTLRVWQKCEGVTC